MASRLPDALPQRDAICALEHREKTQEKSGYRVIVRLERRGPRLLDRDNLIGGAKGLLDCIRYAGLIRGDTETDIQLEVTQTKVAKKDFGTRIEIEYP